MFDVLMLPALFLGERWCQWMDQHISQPKTSLVYVIIKRNWINSEAIAFVLVISGNVADSDCTSDDDSHNSRNICEAIFIANILRTLYDSICFIGLRINLYHYSVFACASELYIVSYRFH